MIRREHKNRIVEVGLFFGLLDEIANTVIQKTEGIEFIVADEATVFERFTICFASFEAKILFR